jgi:hypothetical protein
MKRKVGEQSYGLQLKQEDDESIASHDDFLRRDVYGG